MGRRHERGQQWAKHDQLRGAPASSSSSQCALRACPCLHGLWASSAPGCHTSANRHLAPGPCACLFSNRFRPLRTTHRIAGKLAGLDAQARIVGAGAQQRDHDGVLIVTLLRAREPKARGWAWSAARAP